MSVGADAPLILRGRIEAASWSPGRRQGARPAAARILQPTSTPHDPLLAAALASGLATEAMAKVATAPDAKSALTPPAATADAPSPACRPPAPAAMADQADAGGAALRPALQQGRRPRASWAPPWPAS